MLWFGKAITNIIISEISNHRTSIGAKVGATVMLGIELIAAAPLIEAAVVGGSAAAAVALVSMAGSTIVGYILSTGVNVFNPSIDD